MRSSPLLLLLLSIVHLSCRTNSDGSEVKKFYENSRRRTTELDERRAIGKLAGGGCTAFWVEAPSKNLVVTATHCTNRGDFASWCKNGGYVTDVNDAKHDCVKPIANDANHDIVLFEVTGTLNEPGYPLAAYSAARYTYLRTIGFPNDNLADKSGPMITENCWIVDEMVPDTRVRVGLDEAARHNCSIYGGNSGGPMIAEGSNDVVGLPNEFIEGDKGTTNRPFNSEGSFMVKTSDFVRTFRKELTANKVSIAEQPSQAVLYDRKYLSSGTYHSPTLPTCKFHVLPKYFSSINMHALRVIYLADGINSTCHNDEDNYTCDDVPASVCRSGKATVSNMGPKGFIYVSPSGVQHDFSLQ